MNKRIFDPYSSFVHQFDHFLFDKLPPKSIVDRLVGGQISRFEISLSGKIVVQRLEYAPSMILARNPLSNRYREGREERGASPVVLWTKPMEAEEVAQIFYNELIKRPSASHLPLANKYI